MGESDCEELLLSTEERQTTEIKTKLSPKRQTNNDVTYRYVIDRAAHSVPDFEKEFSGVEKLPPSPSMRDRARKCAKGCNKNCFVDVLVGLFPIFTWMRHYNVRKWLPGDLVSGITVGVVHIPQSMAFSLLAGLPPVYGLYTSFYTVLLYSFMGTSRHISVGTFAVTSLLTQSVVVRLVPEPIPIMNVTAGAMVGNETLVDGISDIELRKVGVAASVMFLMGVFQLVFGIFRLGFITTYLSEPLVQAFTTGAALQVVTSQIPSILGITIKSTTAIPAFFRNWIEIFRNLPNTHIPTLIISIICILLLVAGREINLRFKERLKLPLPTEVIIVVIAILASTFGKFQETFRIRVVGPIPTGFPAPMLPDFSIMGSIIGDGFALAVVGFAISVSLSKMYAQKYGYSIDSNQELIAYGVSNAIPSFFRCFPNAAALARCVIQENTGGNTQLVGLISVVIVLVTILVLGPVFQPLPRSVLGCIIVVGLVGILQQFSLLKPTFKMSRIDCLVWVVTLFSVLLLGVDLGLLAGVVFSMLTIILRTQRPRCEVLGNIVGTDVYRSCHGYASAQPHNGILIFKFHSLLYYANKDYFKQKLFFATGFDPEVIIHQRKKEADAAESQNESSNCCRSIPWKKKTDISSIKVDVDLSSPATSGGSPSFLQQSHSSCPEDVVTRTELFHTLIIDCSSFSFIDLVGIKTLNALCKNYREIGVDMLLVNVSNDVKKSLIAGSYFEMAGENSEFPTIHDAVLHAKYKQVCLSQNKEETSFDGNQ
ncbi:SLC26A2 anion exchanger isoform X1 [Ciona intestinalis]